jgi:hypothetical protein
VTFEAIAVLQRAIGDRTFVFQQSLEPDRTSDGAIHEFFPADRFLNAAGLPLHSYGEGPFCAFRIGAPAGLPGVYALIVDDEVRYLGECADLRARFNAGYGIISPRNCFVGGQPTNCRINRRVLEVVKAGGRVDLYFLLTSPSDRKAVELELLARFSPPWNGRLGIQP